MLWENLGIGIALVSWYAYRFISFSGYANAGNITVLIMYILNLIVTIIHYQLAKRY